MVFIQLNDTDDSIIDTASIISVWKDGKKKIGGTDKTGQSHLFTYSSSAARDMDYAEIQNRLVGGEL